MCAETQIIPSEKQFFICLHNICSAKFLKILFYFSDIKLYERMNISASPRGLQQESPTQGIAKSGKTGDCSMKCNAMGDNC